MKQCPTCGQPVTDNVGLCPNCGAPISAASAPAPDQDPAWTGSAFQPQTIQAPPKKGPSAVVIAAIAAAAAAVVLLGVLLIPRLFPSPEKEFVTYQQQTFVTPLLAILETDVDVGGAQTEFPSTDMTLTMDTDSPELRPFLEDTRLELKLDAGRDSILYNAEAVLMGEPILSGTVTYDSGQLGLLLPEADSNYYVMDLAAMFTQLYGQEFDLGEAKAPEISGKEWAALMQTYLDLVNTAITRDNVTLEKRQEFTLEEADASCTGNVYTFTPTAADVEGVINSLAGHLEEDRQLRSLILKLADEETLMEALGNQYSSLDDALDGAAAYLRSNAAQAGREVEDSGFTWKLYMERKTLRMVRWTANGSSLVWENAGDSAGGTQVLYLAAHSETQTVFRHDYHKDGESSRGEMVLGAEGNELTVTYSNRDGSYEGSVVMNSGGERITLGYRLENGRTAHEYKGSVTTAMEGQTITLDFQWNDETRSALGVPYGSYSMRMDSHGEEIGVALEVAAGASGGTDHVLTVRTPMSEAGISWMSFTLHTTDEKSTAVRPSQAPVDITNYSGEELNALFEDLSGKLYEQVFTQLYAGLYGF